MSTSAFQNIFGEVKNNAELLSAFFQSVGQYLYSPDGNEPPKLSSISGINVDVLTTSSDTVKNQSPGLSVGALSDLMLQSVALKREVEMLSLSRDSYYNAAIGESSIVANNSQADMYKGLNYIRGASIEQSEGF